MSFLRDLIIWLQPTFNNSFHNFKVPILQNKFIDRWFITFLQGGDRTSLKIWVNSNIDISSLLRINNL